MMDYLANYLADRKQHFPSYARWLKTLTSSGAEQQTIIKFCKKSKIPLTHYGEPHSMARIQNMAKRPGDVLPCEEWEARVIQIAGWFNDFLESDKWESAPSEDRTAHCKKVATLARKLASALEKSPAPYYPRVLGLFDEAQAIDIIKALPERTARALLAGCARPFGDKTASSRLASRFDYEGQNLSSLLQNLADYATKAIHERKRSARPNTGNPNARAFTKMLADNFKSFYGRTPNEVIAACVCLKYPAIDPPPNKEDIRSWRNCR